MPPEGLKGLLAKAKVRNHGLGVTGMLLFAENQFYQWLEGPPEGVGQVWDDIQKDPRHGQVQLIDHHRRSRRLFGGWDMKFICREPALAGVRDRAAAPTPFPPAMIRLTAQLALKGDDRAIAEGFEQLLLMGHDRLSLHSDLVEPAARLLGDWWLEDQIRAVEITIALSHLQTVVRRIGDVHPDRAAGRNAVSRVLVAPLPGEPHLLGAALVGDAFHRAGWQVTGEFPPTVEALADCVRSTRFDVLSLCVSDVLERCEQILPLTDAIRAARTASCNPDLVILAGGRLFQMQPDLAAFIGADAVYVGAAEAMTKIPGKMAGAGRGVRLSFH